MRILFSTLLFLCPALLFGQASKIISTQATPLPVSAPNFAIVNLLDTPVGQGNLYRFYIAKWDSLRWNVYQVRGMKDSAQNWGDARYAQLFGAYTNPAFVNSLSASKVFGLSNVALTGNYSDLSGTPNLSLYYLASNPNGFINGITSGMVSAALGYAPYNGTTNPNGYITSAPTYAAGYGLALNSNSFRIDTSQVMTTTRAADSIASLDNKISGKVPNSRTITVNGVTQDLNGNRSWSVGDVTTASLSAYLQKGDSSLYQTKYREDTARTNIYTAINTKQTQLNGIGFVKASGTTISYDNSTYLTSVPAQSFASLTGKPTTLSGYGIADATSNARSAISLTTTGTSGAATYNSTTGVLNVPTYATPSAPTFNNAPARSLNSAYQISTTRNTRVSYSVTCVTALSLLNLNGTAQAFLEISADGSTGWITLNGAGIARTLSVAITIGLNESSIYNIQGEIPATYYCRIRTVTAGTGSTVTFTSGQEVQY